MPDRTVFPPARTDAEFHRVRRDEVALGPGVAAIRSSLGLSALPLLRFADGSLPVYAIGEDHVLKLYPPVHLDERAIESAALVALEGRLPIPTPRLRATDDLEGWGYVLMERLRGESLAAAWPRLEARDRRSLAGALGEALSALHGVDAPALGPEDWSRFVAEQRTSATSRQRVHGLPDHWVEQIDPFLDCVPLDPAPRRALLHTEVMREHLLVARRGDGWALTGLFDFEPAMLGAPEYEFASVGLFVSSGEAGLLRTLLAAYGYPPGDLDGALERRLLAYTLLHRYSNLPWYLSRLPPPPRETLESLASRWWGVVTD